MSNYISNGNIDIALCDDAIGWLKAIKTHYIHGGDETYDACRKRAIDVGCEALELLKEQERNEGDCNRDCFEPWDVLWKASDGTFKGRCDNCGFVHVFIEGHVTQYKFCPQCGEQKQEL